MIKAIVSYMKHSRYSLSSLFLTFISLLAIIGSLTYLIYGLSPKISIFIFISSLVITFSLRSFFIQQITENIHPIQLLKDKFNLTLLVSYVFLFSIGIFLLISNRSQEPLISPWEVVPTLEFIIFAVATGILLILLQSFNTRLSTIVLTLHYFWSFSIAIIIYSVGYGYDPFIHQAAVTAIEELGRIYPTTYYYLGQYSLVTIFHSIFQGTIAWWDKLLVPVLASILLPLSFAKLIIEKNLKTISIGILLLLLPFSFFIITTPQNLAYIFLIVLIIWSINLRQTKDLILLWLLAIATLVTQPIAGIPAILLVASKSNQFISFPILKRSINWLIIISYFLAIPLAFYIFSNSDPLISLQLQWPSLQSLTSLFILKNPIKEVWWLNLIYFFEASRGWLYLLLLAFGFYLAHRNKLKNYFAYFGLPMLALLASSILSTSINFNFLIDYERTDYSGRILLIAAFFGIPYIILALDNFQKKLFQHILFIKVNWILMLSALITTSLYLSYPRFDHFHNSHGYATSAAEIETVHWIENNAHDQPFIVLANQQVSAAALREFGFKKYYNNLFYYPVPTGGALYQTYLKMIDTPQLSTIDEARKLTGVDTVYVVLNDYWWAADKLGPELAAIANNHTMIQNGKIQIFIFSK
jgi:hypothetical protein